MKQLVGNDDVQRFILDRLDQIDAKIQKPASARKRSSKGVVEVFAAGEKESLDEFSAALLHYRVCDSLEGSAATDGTVRIAFDPLREREGIEDDIRAIAAKFSQIRVERVVVK
jgi:hypothetical protein